MTEKKQNRMHRTPSLDGAKMQQDQALKRASGAPQTDRLPTGNGRDSAARKNREARGGAERAEKSAANAGRRPRNPASGKKQGSANAPRQNQRKTQGAPQNTAEKTGVVKSLPNRNTNKPANHQIKPGKPGKPSIKIYFLGGLNEIGKNFTVFECCGDMVIIDCGLAFPDDDMLGVDVVIPDFHFIEKNADKIKGIVVTHGHEDHIGAIPYLLKRINVPIYATALTVGLIEVKLKEHGLAGTTKTQVTSAGSHVKLGCMDIELIHVNHSISDAVGVAIHSPAGTIVHTGDFKIDCTPAEGAMIDIARFAELGRDGVLALMADSTNAERAGYTQTEQKVNESLISLFARAEGKRLIVATFASNISRVQQIINCAEKYGRKVALSGRSMLNVMGIASELGYLHIPEGILIDLSLINRYDNGQIVLITTGSQGEPMSALTRMAFDDHRQVAVGENDFIILSARPIPGNEKMVGTVVDELLKRGCTVVYESMYEVHVSGHACQEELKLMQGLVKPKYFIPVHGEQKHLRKHAGIAVSMGMNEKNIFIGAVGSALELNEEYMKVLPDVQAGDVMVDGLGVGDVGSVVLKDRKRLAEDGLIIAVCTIEKASGELVSGPDVVSRGFVYVRESEELMDEAKKIVYNTLKECSINGYRDWGTLKIEIRDSLSGFLYEKTKRSPMILPIIMEV